jgi:branched-subunit amino acid transport protein
MNEWLLLLLAGFLPTEIWRWAGVFASKGIEEGSEVLDWVRAVATATMAAVVAKLAFYPSGELANLTLNLRLSALVIGIVAYFLMKRSVLAGVLIGEAVLVAGAYFI